MYISDNWQSAAKSYMYVQVASRRWHVIKLYSEQKYCNAKAYISRIQEESELSNI